MVTDGLCGIGPARPTRIASYSVSVRRVAALLPRFFQTAPHDGRPCASLALCLTGPGQRTFTSKLSNMLGTPGPVDAQNAPTRSLENAQSAFPTATTALLVVCLSQSIDTFSNGTRRRQCPKAPRN